MGNRSSALERQSLNLHWPVADLQLNEICAPLSMPVSALMATFANEMDAYIYEIFIPMRVLLIAAHIGFAYSQRVFLVT
jgi:hypothetical protein